MMQTDIATTKERESHLRKSKTFVCLDHIGQGGSFQAYTDLDTEKPHSPLNSYKSLSFQIKDEPC
jgi:hypothetical protein